jgi:aminoglycoside phosphotransferase (APT) family kinase protein
MYHVPSVVPWSLADRDLAQLGIPNEQSYVETYCDRTGRAAIPHLRFYLAFNLFRFAAIVHGIKGRMIRGNAASANASGLVGQLDLFAAKARGLAEDMDRL